MEISNGNLNSDKSFKPLKEYPEKLNINDLSQFLKISESKALILMVALIQEYNREDFEDIHDLEKTDNLLIDKESVIYFLHGAYSGELFSYLTLDSENFFILNAKEAENITGLNCLDFEIFSDNWREEIGNIEYFDLFDNPRFLSSYIFFGYPAWRASIDPSSYPIETTKYCEHIKLCEEDADETDCGYEGD